MSMTWLDMATPVVYEVNFEPWLVELKGRVRPELYPAVFTIKMLLSEETISAAACTVSVLRS